MGFFRILVYSAGTRLFIVRTIIGERCSLKGLGNGRLGHPPGMPLASAHGLPTPRTSPSPKSPSSVVPRPSPEVHHTTHLTSLTRQPGSSCCLDATFACRLERTWKPRYACGLHPVVGNKNAGALIVGPLLYPAFAFRRISWYSFVWVLGRCVPLGGENG